MSEVVKESTHWYTKDGEPAYTVKGKSGERPTTLRDARKLGLVPSVTTIMQEAYRPGLQAWKDEQLLYAALTLPRLPEEPEEAWIARVRLDAKETAKKAAERGTDIHKRIELGFEGQLPDDPYFLAANIALVEEAGIYEWSCEKSFANHRYGGKVDLHTDNYVFDIKTTDKHIDAVKLWDEHYMQLAAYREGLPYVNLSAKCGILYVSTLDISAKVLWAEEDKLQRGYRMFTALLDYWYSKTSLGEKK